MTPDNKAIIEELEKRFEKLRGLRPHFDYAELENWLLSILEQKDHQIAEARKDEREKLEGVQRDLEARIEHPDNEYCMVCDETLHHIKSLTNPNNPK